MTLIRLPIKIGINFYTAFGSKYMDDIAEEYGRDGTLNNPATSGKKGSFWD